MRSFKMALAGMMAAGVLLALNSAAHAQAVITNGTIRLGVRDLGHLGLPGGASIPDSVQGNDWVGVRLMKPGIGELEYTADGCVCEGWGVANASTGERGFANV